MMATGFEPRNYGLRNSRLATELPKPIQPCQVQIMYLYLIWRLGPYDLRPVQSHNSNFDLKKPYQMHNKSSECLEITILWI